MTPKIKPLKDKVLLKLVDPVTKTGSGIFLPDDATDEQHIAVVIAVGPGTVNEKGEKVPVEVKVGQKVLIRGKWAGDNVVLEGIEYKIVADSDILAVVD